MPYEQMMALLEEYGHTLNTRETIVLSNILTGHRTISELAAFLKIPVFQVISARKTAVDKFRNAAIAQLKKLKASDEIIDGVVSSFSKI